MDFSRFALSRDLLYSAGAVTGIALGLFLSLLRKDLDQKSRNRRITLALLFFSGTIAAFALSFIVSHGSIFQYKAVLAVSGVCTALCIPAVYFPRAVAFPLILLGGLIVTWLGIFCLRFPELESAPALTLSYPENSESGDMYLSCASDTQAAGSGAHADETGIIQINGTRAFLNCTVAVMEIKPHFPFIGGRTHGVISEVYSDTGLDYSDKFLNGSPARFFFVHTDSLEPVTGISFRELHKTIIPDDPEKEFRHIDSGE
jgi:multisubunit Na+/H+ antiporter MnhB subunit